MRNEPLSKTIINCARQGIPLRIIQPNGVIIESGLTNVDLAYDLAPHDNIAEITQIADQFKRRAGAANRA